MRHWNQKPHQDGFTLAELLVVLTLIAIFLALAVPGFSSFMQRYRLSTTSNDFLSSVLLTRSEALKRGRRIDMIPVNGNWQDGWIVFVDGNNDQLTSNDEEIIHRHDAMPQGLQVSKGISSGNSCGLASGMPFTQGGRTYIAYSATGHSRQNSGAFLAGSMVFINGQNQRCLVINSQGRPRITGN